MHKTYMRILEPIVAVLVLAAVGYVLSFQLRHLTLNDVLDQWHSKTNANLLLAVGITAMAYIVLSGYDLLGMIYVRRRVAWYRTAFASVLSYIFSLNVGMSIIGASAMRLRLYPRWGLTPLDIGKLVYFSASAFWLGILTVAGICILIAPVHLPASVKLPGGSLITAGILMLISVIIYVSLCATFRKPLRFRTHEVGLPSWPLALSQVAIGSIDWIMAGTVLYILLPSHPDLHYPMVLTMFILAQLAAQASHVPGGIGVLEAVLLGLLGPYFSAAEITGSAIIFRLIYFFGPLAIGALAMGGYEIQRWVGAAGYNRRPAHDP